MKIWDAGVSLIIKTKNHGNNILFINLVYWIFLSKNYENSENFLVCFLLVLNFSVQNIIKPFFFKTLMSIFFMKHETWNKQTSTSQIVLFLNPAVYFDLKIARGKRFKVWLGNKAAKIGKFWVLTLYVWAINYVHKS